MNISRYSPLLRQALIADAILSGVTGLLVLIAARFLAGLLHLPEPFLRYAGLILIPFVIYVAFVGTRESLQPGSVHAVIILNVLWVAASILVLLSGLVAPNMLGTLFILVQALAVAVFAVLQYRGLNTSLVSPA